MLLRIAVVLQLVVGITLWTGHGYSLLRAHMTVGMTYVLLFWIIAIIALVKRRHMGLALAALPWGAIVIALGVTQQRILPGDLHWIVRIVHLVVGLSVMPMAERLAAAAKPAAV
jgi:hypothetical protein